MRDEFDYSAMGREELRSRLVETAKQLATWEYALAQAKSYRNRAFMEAYASSTGRSVADRRMEAEVASSVDQNEVLENEGQVLFYRTIRDMIVVMLAQVQVDV